MQLAINTTQNVTLNFQVASVGDRILAQVIDTLIRLAYVFVINLSGVLDFLPSNDGWEVMAVEIVVYSPVLIYSLVLESLWEGQTFGKKLMKIKVIKIDGYQASFVDYLIRWMFRIIEFNIAIIGLLALIFSKTNQRLGDMAAGTAVISLKNNININHTILQEVNNDYVPTYPLVIKLSDNDVRIVKETFETAVATRDYATLIKLREKVIQVTGIKNVSGNDQDFIRTLLKDYNFYTQNM